MVQIAFVNVFLRRLEYFQGILLMTTNRRENIDEAIETRIHFKLPYLPLNVEGRLAIWKVFLPGMPTEELVKLSHLELNGREIKNAASCALSVHKSMYGSQVPLRYDTVVDIMNSLSDSWAINEKPEVKNGSLSNGSRAM